MIKETTQTIAKKALWYPLIRARHRVQAEREVGFINDPVLIYQMGKVGSSTVYESLHEAGVEGVFHLHYLSGNLSGRVRRRQNHGLHPTKHLFISQALKRRIRHPGFQCKIITLVRDPIARKISELFEMYRLTASGVAGTDGRLDAQRALDYLRDRLESPDCYNYAFNWFDRELKIVFGVDVFAYPFDKEAGYTRIENERTDVLVVRLENLSQLLPTVISDFMGCELDVVVGNRRANTSDAEAYRTVKQNVSVSPEACRRIYNTPFVQHFYSEPMIEAFIERWSH